jgi:hypothetical protein
MADRFCEKSAIELNSTDCNEVHCHFSGFRNAFSTISFGPTKLLQTGSGAQPAFYSTNTMVFPWG